MGDRSENRGKIGKQECQKRGREGKKLRRMAGREGKKGVGGDRDVRAGESVFVTRVHCYQSLDKLSSIEPWREQSSHF